MAVLNLMTIRPVDISVGYQSSELNHRLTHQHFIPRGLLLALLRRRSGCYAERSRRGEQDKEGCQTQRGKMRTEKDKV